DRRAPSSCCRVVWSSTPRLGPFPSYVLNQSRRFRSDAVCCGPRAERDTRGGQSGAIAIAHNLRAVHGVTWRIVVQFGMSRLNVRRIVTFVASSIALAAVFGTGLIARQGDTAFASSWLPYHQGYYTTQGWMCYGWTNGTWHCTSHWYRTGAGTLVSQNTAWVPNNLGQGSWSKAIPDSQRDVVPHQDRARKPAPPAHQPVAHPAQAYHPAPIARPAPARPAPPAPSVGQQVVINDIYATFGAYAGAAMAIARCESGYNPYAVNPIVVLGSHAQGVFQILYPSTWNTTSYRAQSPFNYDANIHAAYQIFARDGFSWREWQCQP
ncbi:MAG TPA: transglycosylase SLT domain-containing protein, partial [Ktedonobacterales bacterium]|nr:transglycosylase SLT domain-containing protein [Ktedonobacterales bacterium]